MLCIKDTGVNSSHIVPLIFLVSSSLFVGSSIKKAAFLILKRALSDLLNVLGSLGANVAGSESEGLLEKLKSSPLRA